MERATLEGPGTRCSILGLASRREAYWAARLSGYTLVVRRRLAGMVSLGSIELPAECFVWEGQCCPGMQFDPVPLAD